MKAFLFPVLICFSIALKAQSFSNGDTLNYEYSNDSLFQVLSVRPVNDSVIYFTYKITDPSSNGEISISGQAKRKSCKEAYTYREGSEFEADRFVYQKPNCKLSFLIQSDLRLAAWVEEDCLSLQVNSRCPLGSKGLMHKRS